MAKAMLEVFDIFSLEDLMFWHSMSPFYVSDFEIVNGSK